MTSPQGARARPTRLRYSRRARAPAVSRLPAGSAGVPPAKRAFARSKDSFSFKLE